MHTTDHLLPLVQAGLIEVHTPAADAPYNFRHALIQDAAYGTLLRVDRKHLHRLVGETLEALYPENLPELALTLGRHFAEAGEAARALPYYTQAATRALAGGANVEAAAAYRAALDLAPPLAAAGPLWFGLGEAVMRQGHYGAAQDAWATAIGLAAARGDGDLLAHCYTRQARAAWAAGDAPASLRFAEAGVAALGAGPPTPGRAGLIHEWARALIHNGRLGEAAAPARRALQMAEHLGIVEVQVETLATLALLPGTAPGPMLAALAAAITQAEAAGLLVAAGRAHNNRAEILEQQGDLPAAQAHYVRGVALFARLGIVAGQIWFYNNLARVALQTGDLAAVAALLPHLRQLLVQTPNARRGQLGVAVIEAELCYYAGDAAGARPLLDACRQEAGAAGDLQLLQRTTLDLIEVLLDLAAPAAPADPHLAQATQLAEALAGDPSVAIWCARATVAARAGRLTEAAEWLAMARAQATTPPLLRDAESLALAEARLAVAQADGARAATAFAAAVAAQQQSGRRWYEAHTRQEWAVALSRAGTSPVPGALP